MRIPILLSLALLATGPAQAGEAPIRAWSQSQLSAVKPPAIGAAPEILDGDLAKSGTIVTYEEHLSDGMWIPPHVDTQATRIFVLKGVLLLGQGGSEDRGAVRRLRTGEFAIIPAAVAHYEGVEEDTILVCVTVAPLQTLFIIHD